MTCSFPDCGFSTPANIPTYELVIKTLEMHVQSAHMLARPTNTVSDHSSKTEKPKRPTLTSGMSESD